MSSCSLQLLLAELKECSNTRDLQRGKQLHAEALQLGLDSSVYVASALINMYAKCGSMLDAQQMFCSIKRPDVVAWNVLILGYADNGQALPALDLFKRMRSEGLSPDAVTFVAGLKACIATAAKGQRRSCLRLIHNLAIEKGFDSDVHVQSTLIFIYARCGRMVDANQVFSSMKHPSVASWNSLLQGYAENGEGLTILYLLKKMKCGGLVPDSATFLAALKACTSLAAKGRSEECKQRGRKLHALAVESSCDSDIYLQSTLVAMYSKCGCMVDAHQVFVSIKHPDTVSWNVLILGYAENGHSIRALALFKRMRTEGLAPDSVTFVAALKACTSLALQQGWEECSDRGKQLHNLAMEQGNVLDVYMESTLIDMYTKCGSMQCARQVFDCMRHHSTVSWTVLIRGYADNGQGLAALDLFTRMRSTGPAPDSVTFAAAIKACGLVGGLQFGRSIHSEMQRRNVLDVVLVSCLVDFYAKCGSLVEAQGVFDLHPGSRNIVTWTALLSGFSSCGDHQSVFRLFEEMQTTGLPPDSVTFLCILACCSHAGLVEKGQECFQVMLTKYGISPTVEHYNAMLNLLGRANKLDDAMALLHSMPCSPNDATWMSILGACRKWRNLELGRLAFLSLSNLSSDYIAGYVLLRHIYGS